MNDIADLMNERVEEIERFTLSHRAYAAELYFLEKEFGSLYLQNHQLRIRAFGLPNPSTEPIRRIPDDLLDRFTMSGRVPIVYTYRNESYPSEHPYIYTDNQIDYFIEMQRSGHYFYYGQLDEYIEKALKKYDVPGHDILNIGSITPWYDALCIRLGVKPTTVDYNRIISQSSRTTTMTLEELRRSERVFDYALSISSIEHDGLGGYGDPIDPDGDLKNMKEMKGYLAKGGLMFFNVPIGKDVVYFNRERVYGRIRLPRLLEDWELIDSYGFDDDVLDGKHPGPPLLVLRNV